MSEILRSLSVKTILGILLMGGLSLIILNPIGIPVRPDEYTLAMYEDLDALPDDSVIVFQAQAGIAYIPEVGPSTISLFNLLFNKNTKIIIFSVVEEGPIYVPQLLDGVKKSILDKNVYGEDYVVFGFAPGRETAMATFAADIRSVYAVDIFGTPTDDIPMMKNINSHVDFDAIIPISGSTPMNEASVRVWDGTYDKDLYIITSGTDFASAQPYYPNQILGLTNGVLGGAQLEILVGIPGKGAQLSDGLSYAFLLAIAVIFAGNYVSFQKKRRSLEQ